MDFYNCNQCGSKFSKRNLHRVDDKLKKNVSIFKDTFDKLNIINPKFCRNCQKTWMRLENIRGKSNIENFISDREKEINIKTKAKVTSVTDDAQKLTPSCSHTKNTCSNSTVYRAEDLFPSNEKHSNLHTLSDEFLAVPGPSKNQTNPLQVPETVTVRHYSYQNGKTEQQSDLLVQVQTTLYQNEVTSIQKQVFQSETKTKCWKGR